MSAPDTPAADAAPPFDGREFARQLPHAPGVYRMLDAQRDALYVGKADSLRNRVGSYFSGDAKSARIALMLSKVAAMEVTVTRTEGEALILENQLIKSLRPRYNILLRDDKSYPYIRIGTEHAFPRIQFHRGPRREGRYFGPYPGVLAVRETLNLMHKLFRLRNCEDSVFRNRSRPCLQYQIHRCSAPCVALVSPEDYDRDVQRAILLLEGRSRTLTDELATAMEAASAALAFEEAARLRDLIADIRAVQAKQYVEGALGDLDVLAVAQRDATACVLLMTLRDGRNLGTRAFFPRIVGVADAGDVLSAFVTQHYLDKAVPPEIVLSHALPDQALVESVLQAQAGRKVQLKAAVRGDRARYLDLAQRNADHALAAELGTNAAQQRRRDDLAELLGLEAPPARIECFDISHTMGESTVASCVVFDAEGAARSQYRRYNIEGITPGDDYAAMAQAIERRFRRAQAGEGVLPDLLLIDGGRGQLARAADALRELGVEGVQLVGVAKGEERKAGQETLVLPDGRELRPGPESPGLHLIQQVRDEAHRFAITGHRGRRSRTRDRSRLEDIEGIGAKRRAKLLRHFGGLPGLLKAGAEEIAAVDGIGSAMAQRIYAALRGLESS